MMKQILSTNAPGWAILIRLTVGCVFLSQGIQKFLFPAEIGAGAWSVDAWLNRRSGGRAIGG